MKTFSTCAILLCLALPQAVSAQAPFHVYLTWEGSTTRSMTVNAHTDASITGAEVRWGQLEEDHEGPVDLSELAQTATGAAHQVPDLEDQRNIHVITLDGLTPGGVYGFVVGSDENGWSAARKFRTISDSPDAPMRFLSGGDMGLSWEVRALLAHGAAAEPHFAVIGGDVSYADGALDNVDDWDDWFNDWERVMVTPEGFTVPMVIAAGNHEVQGGYLGGADRSPFFFGFFAQPGNESYFRMTFGPNLVMYVLDTGHVVSHESQTGWMREVMAEDSAYPNRFALYHVPLWPSHRPYDEPGSIRGREHWMPLFDEFALTTALENHDHTLKRTKLLRGGEVDPQGTLYLGDGAWGRGDRPIDLTPRWYLEKAGATRHVWIIDVTPGGNEYRAVDLRGQVIDAYPADLPGASMADAYFATLEQQWQLAPGALEVETPAGLDPRDLQDVAITVTVRNNEEGVMAGRISAEAALPLTLEGPSPEISLQPGEEFTTEFLLNGDVGDGIASASVTAALDFTRPDGSSVALDLTSPIAVEQDFVLAGGDMITLDGDLSDWAGATAVGLTAAAPYEEFGHDGWTGPDDSSAQLFMREVDGMIYFGLTIQDDELITGSPTTVDDGDAVLFWWDPLPGGEFDDDPYMGISAPSGDGPAEVIVTDPDWASYAAAVSAVAQRTDAGWDVEFSVPSSRLGDAEAFRFNFALVDLDTGFPEQDTIHWRPRWESIYDSPAWGVVRRAR
ncbi:MAG: fibronectin type III domain-containing protein [Longimicrobiales bacterium]|nr:fibronectin type III domain-containing protein [Longimicrobiales bacterium]